MRNIVLTGFSGTGKSAVARAVADILDWQAVDTDAEIVRKAGRPIARIFEAQGEPAFRDMERGAVQEACAGQGRVIAVGGGAIMDAGSRSVIEKSAFLVCLEARPETILHRLREQQRAASSPEERPLLSSDDPLSRIRELKAQRQAVYAQAHWTVHTDALTLNETAHEVVRAWRNLALKEGQIRSPFAGDPNLAATVETTTGSCPVLAGWELLGHLGELLEKGGVKGPVYVISDDKVASLYLRGVQQSLRHAEIENYSYTFPAGERSKSLATAMEIYEWLAEHKARRDGTLLALGGGVTGDLTGFVAATYNRGMNFVQAPTSVAAMVDASIGGKTAVDLPYAKNLVGAFYQPRMVVADVAAMRTLPKRETMEGWAEAIKHGLILDAGLFATFEDRADAILDLQPELTTSVIRRSMAIKANVVSQDERETKGVRVLLNYGHTIGHGLEAATAYGAYLHGEAVSIGMMGAVTIGIRMGVTPPSLLDRQTAVLRKFNLPMFCPGVDLHRVEAAMSLDKKAIGSGLRWVLLQEVGRATTRTDVPLEMAQRVLRELAR